MAQRLLGQETEFGFAAFSPDGARLGGDRPASLLLAVAGRRLPHLPDMHSHGMFLASGGRFYMDAGHHPEGTTPECPNPWDVVRYNLALEEILTGLGAAMKAADPGIGEVMFFKSNVDYSGSGNSWGCHENYMHCVEPDVLTEQLIPHLASRVIYTGCGGFDPFAPGLDFMLSPRVAHLRQVTSADSMHARALCDTRNEPLAGLGYHRAHLLCGESLCSHTSAWLKIATTALVVALVEGGVRPANAVPLRSPLDATRCFATDTTCRAVVEAASNTYWTALGIQYHYLALAEARVDAPFMPPWAGEVCRHWSAILQRLESAPYSVSATLDWAIKLVLYRERARRRGISWEQLPAWNSYLADLASVLGRQQPTLDAVCELPLDELKRMASQYGLCALELPAFLELRDELFELDTRFGQLGAGGVFAALDRAGVLHHRFPGVDNIAHAMVSPPASGRARVRGACVQRLAAHPDEYSCTWDQIVDNRRNRRLDLSDPFVAGEAWEDLRKAGPAETEYARDMAARLRTLRERERQHVRF